ncbi:MAG: nucleotidyltransferase domain-containing protein, partial [archaeon]
ANKDDPLFIQVHRSFWLMELKNSGLLSHLERELTMPLAVLFGSVSKAELREDSDIDLVVFSQSFPRKQLDLGEFETKLKRKLHLFAEKDKETLKSRELLSSYLNGFIVVGKWEN